jgi:hypothetical protein
MREWRRHLYYTTTSIKTTWTLRAAVLVVLILIGVSTRGALASYVGRSLVCQEDLAPSDVMLVENFDPSYLVFERAAALKRAGLASRTLVPIGAARADAANPVSKGIAEVMARQARLTDWEIVPVWEVEPISLNAANQVRSHLAGDGVTSLIVVTPGFRSRRSSLVYRAVLGAVGTQIHCVPVFGRTTPERWMETWHGIQQVTEEFVKLQYYRFYVLPFMS